VLVAQFGQAGSEPDTCAFAAYLADGQRQQYEAYQHREENDGDGAGTGAGQRKQLGGEPHDEVVRDADGGVDRCECKHDGLFRSRWS
jgi:hypothetical protein